jgi:hypothetical protein
MIVRWLGVVAVLALSACAPPPSSRSGLPQAAVPAAPGAQPSDPGRPAAKTVDVPPLIGLGSREVETLFGQPRFVRRDGPAQIWQYGTEACTVNLFFYRDGPMLRVRHVEFRNRSSDLAAAGGCEGAVVSMVQAR